MLPRRRLETWVTRCGWISLAMVYLVVCAGATVRASGAGMGCPDWPRCFGYWIPPTSPEQITWAPGKDIHAGKMIIHPVNGQQRLLVAKSHFTTDEAINWDNWQVFDRHDYASFDPRHTWTEYINRLFGAASGVPVLALVALSIAAAIAGGSWLRAIGAVTALSILGTVAWLGKVVVDGNLIPGHITIHMFGALSLIMVLLAVIHAGGAKTFAWSFNTSPTQLVARSMVFLGVAGQIYLGAEVREVVDGLGKSSTPRSEWVENLGDVLSCAPQFIMACRCPSCGVVVVQQTQQQPATQSPSLLCY